MEFGLGLMGYDGCWDDARFAEGHGFATAGFVDSPLLGGDPFVCMGLAAKATEKIRLGTFLAIPSNRNAATVAAGAATVNKLAPGRTFIGMGTGYTGRQTFGLGPVAASKLGNYASTIRGLLDGQTVPNRVGDSERLIRFKHKAGMYVDTNDIPIYVAADGPKALNAAGSCGDGLVVTLQYSHIMGNSPDVFAGSLAAAREAAAAAGKDWDDVYTMWSIVHCVLEEGESAASPRVLERVGAAAMMAFHSYACNPHIAEHLPPPIKDRLEIYEKEVLSRFGLPREQVYMEAHAGHLSHMLNGEAAVLTDELVRMTTLTGTATEIVDVLRKLEAAGLKNVSFWAPPHQTREVVTEVAEQLMPALSATPA
jgi:alkanesulfonate monooxygenase SsuD/methylene tetrahydromethanopterin reductase-like flavin-dependent oxidoreductase (luciferase family)